MNVNFYTSIPKQKFTPQKRHPLDYDNWANITGDTQWKYENVLPYFKKSIDYHGEHANGKLSKEFAVLIKK